MATSPSPPPPPPPRPQHRFLPNTPTTTMESLPPELLRMILAPTDALRPTYLSLRLVSKTFNAITTPFAFRRLCVPSKDSSVARLTSVAAAPHLRHYVRAYEYTFQREHFSPRLIQGYTYIMSLPEHLRQAGYELLEEGPDSEVRRNVEHYGRQLAFTDLEVRHLEALPKLPNLERLTISMHPDSDTMTLADVPSRAVKWGSTLFHAYLKVLGDRARQTDVQMIRELVVEGLTMDCLIVPPPAFEAGLRGFETLHKVDISIAPCRESSLSILGRLIQSSKALRALSLAGFKSERCGDLADIHMHSLLSPPQLDRSCRQRDLVPPPVARWPHLVSLRLCGMMFSASLIVEFFAHHRALEDLEITLCYLMEGGGRHCPFHNHTPPPLGDEDEHDHADENWRYVFRQLHALLPNPLKLAVFDQLTMATNNPLYFPASEGKGWEKYLTGQASGEPPAEETIVFNFDDFLDDEDYDSADDSLDSTTSDSSYGSSLDSFSFSLFTDEFWEGGSGLDNGDDDGSDHGGDDGGGDDDDADDDYSGGEGGGEDGGEDGHGDNDGDGDGGGESDGGSNGSQDGSNGPDAISAVNYVLRDAIMGLHEVLFETFGVDGTISIVLNDAENTVVVHEHVAHE